MNKEINSGCHLHLYKKNLWKTEQNDFFNKRRMFFRKKNDDYQRNNL